MREIAEEMAAEWIVAEVMNEAPAVNVHLRFFELLFTACGKGLGKGLINDRPDRVDPKRFDVALWVSIE